MASIDSLKASDGSGNASVVTIQNARSPGATTIQGDTVQGINDNFFATMGTPHTFTDPVTGETITVISEDTAVDFKGHVDGSNLEIDTIAPGYVDDGSEVGDIVIIRPTTQWSDEVAEVLEVSHNDDGTFKDDSISDSDMFTDPLNPVIRGSESIFDHVASGLVITGDAYASTRAASITAGVVYIGGVRVSVSAVVARLFTASKDTYVDVGVDGVVDYNEVANNAASPALAANHIRIGIVVTGASNIANVGAINQGQEDKVLPIASSIPYTTTDSLGNLICSRDPGRKILGFRRRTTNLTIGALAEIAELVVPVVVPLGRKVKVTFGGTHVLSGGAGYTDLIMYDGRVGSGGVRIGLNSQYLTGASQSYSPNTIAIQTPTVASKTYSMAAQGPASTTLQAGQTPAFLMVELV